MDAITPFPTDWLDTRFPFDAEARNAAIERQVLHYLETVSTPHLVDLGAGNGANYHYFHSRLRPEPRWTLVEQDPYLVQAARARIPAESVVISPTSILELAQTVDLNAIHLVLANAVFDLFSVDQFRQFVQSLQPVLPPLYFTLNYTHMAFSPEMEGDETFVALYDAHMERAQPFGRSMGAKGPDQIVRILEKAGYGVERGPSYWTIGGEEDTMLLYLLGFMEEAVGEMIGWNGLDLPLQEWIDEKRKLVSLGAVSLTVAHEDIWARCP